MKFSRYLLIAGFALLIFGAKLGLIDFAGSDLPVLDQWDGEAEMTLRPWQNGQLHFAELAHPHNEHRIITTKLYSLGLFVANGQWDNLVEATASAAIHTLAALLLLQFGRRRLRGGWLAGYGVLLVLLFALPSNWENTLVGFQVQFYFLLLFSVGQIWLTLTADRFTWRWAAGQLCGLLALASMASGFLGSLAVLAVIAVRGLRDRRLSGVAWASVACAILFAAVGWASRTEVPGHAVLKAHNVGEFVGSMLQTLAWPLPAVLPIVILPVAIYGFRWLAGKRAAPTDHVLAGLVVWNILQCAALAYGRGGGIVIAPRYFDLFAVNVATSFLCLDFESSRLRTRLGVTWFVLVVVMLGVEGERQWRNAVVPRPEQDAKQEALTREFVAGRSASPIQGKTWPEIPYPDANVLRARLETPELRRILPLSVREPVALIGKGDAPPQAIPPILVHPAFEVAVSTWNLPADKSYAWRSAPQPDTAARLLHFRVAGDLGPQHPGLHLVVKSAAGETEVIPDATPGTRWKNVTVTRPPGTWWVEAHDDDPAGWLAFTEPVEIGRLSWLVHKILKYHAGIWWTGVLLSLIGLSLWSKSSGALREFKPWIRETFWSGASQFAARRSSRFWIAAGLAMVLLKLWLVAGQTVLANGWASHDDRLFLNLAHFILRGEWLGPYTQFTLMKGPAYSIFVAATFLTGLPLFTAQHLFYAAACGLLIVALRPLVRSVWARFGIFVVLLFNPMTYEAVVHGRVLRQNIYHSLVLCALAGFIAIYGRRRAPIRTLSGWAVLAGAALAGFWLTREEGVWLLPLVILLWLFLCWRLWRERPADLWRRCALYLLPGAVWALGIGTVCTLNYHYYGWFGTVEFKAKEFKDAYGALCRVTPHEWHPLIPVRRETRERIYAVSPTFAELRPYLEGPIGEGWAGAGAGLIHMPPSEREIAGGWFMWALRDAVIAAGHNRSARDVMNFYGRVAREINAACDDGRLAAGPPHSGFFPLWHPEYTKNLAVSLPRTARYFLTFDGFVAESQPSTGSISSLVLFQDLTRDRMTPIPGTGVTIPPQQRWLDGIRVSILSQIGHLYQALILLAAITAGLAFLIATAASIIRRRLDFWLVLNLGLIGACMAMILINALVDATSFPTTSPGGFTADYPLYLLFLWTAWFQLAAALRTSPDGQ